MSLAGGYPGMSLFVAARTLLPKKRQLTSNSLTGTTGTKLVNYVISDRVIRCACANSAALIRTLSLISLTMPMHYRVCSPPELQNLYVEKVAYIPFAIQVRPTHSHQALLWPSFTNHRCWHTQPLAKVATDATGEPLSRRSLGIDKDA
eukprot:COSAG06_NODE_550_length_14402_cov_4.593092_13_plen_148_part_00